MKFICLGYADEKMWTTMSENERNAFMDECLAYDDVLRQHGHFVGGDALQSAQCQDLTMAERQSARDGRPLRRDERAIGRNPCARSEGSGSCHSTDVEAPGSQGGCV